MRGVQVFSNDAAGDQMFLNDALDDRRRHRVIPRAIRIHHGNRPRFADAQAVGFGAKDAALFGELQLLETPLQKIPCGKATVLVAAFGFGLIAAEKDVASGDRHTNAGRDLPLGIGHSGSIFNTCSAV